MRNKHKYVLSRKKNRSVGCILCEIKQAAIKKFEHWIILPNDFPYDKLAVGHDMLVSKRHVEFESDLSNSEKKELLEIKERYIPKANYDMYIENTPRLKSVKGHFHGHLLRLKQVYKGL